MSKFRFKDHRRGYIVIGGTLCFIGLLIWIAPGVPVIAKQIITVAFAGIVITFTVLVYRNMVKNYEEEQESHQPAPTEQMAAIPPKPIRPPQSAQQEEEEQKRTTKPPPILYDHRPRPIPALGRTLLVGAISALLFVAWMNSQTEPLKWVAIICGAVAVIYSYWQWVKWHGTFYIVTEERQELQYVLPWPFATHAPSMPNKAGATLDIKRTFLDRVFGTCRLFSDTPAKGDEPFHNLKWLPYPKELRQALGKEPIRRNSWWIF